MCDEYEGFDWLNYPRDQREAAPLKVNAEEIAELAHLFSTVGMTLSEEMMAHARLILNRPGIVSLHELSVGDYGRVGRSLRVRAAEGEATGLLLNLDHTPTP